jgi:opacity protein-like surface antigen
MIKRLVLFCCLLLLPTIASSQEGNINSGELWLGGQVGGLFADHTHPGVTAGAIVGYNFCMPYRQAWERYFGVAVDFSWNRFNQRYFPDVDINGDQFALSFLGRLQYPLMGDDTFTSGRLTPFLMFGPAIVWSQRDSGDSTDIGVVAEAGFEYFMIPKLSVGPSFRFRHVWLEAGRDQYTVMGRMAYHF